VADNSKELVNLLKNELKPLVKPWQRKAFQALSLSLRHYRQIQIAEMLGVSQQRVSQLIKWARENWPVKVEFEEIIRTIESLINEADIEQHNQPEKGIGRIKALELKIKATMDLARLLGFVPAPPSKEELREELTRAQYDKAIGEMSSDEQTILIRAISRIRPEGSSMPQKSNAVH